LDPHKSEQVRTLVQQYQERLNTLENVFDKAGAPDRPTEYQEQFDTLENVFDKAGAPDRPTE
ncbi:unnamed protein product, partial [Closterium sp. NIES-53]